MGPSRSHLAAAFLMLAATAQADDWPQFRGLNRDAVWNESGILEKFPVEGLKARWRATVGAGLSSPVVAQGRVYLISSILNKPKAQERVQGFDEKSGQPLWLHAYDVSYPDWAFDPKSKGGPNATPTIHDGKIYTLGAMGDLFCLDAIQGTVLWHKSLLHDYGMKEFTGTPCPLIEGDLLILVTGCQPHASVIALDKNSGKEIWKALDDPFTYSSPIVISAGGKRQLIVWTPKAVTSLNPATGEMWWREEVDTTNSYGSATPVLSGDKLLISGLMLRLDPAKPAATLLWPESKSPTKVVLSPCSIPIVQGDYVYSGKSNGHLICLDANTGKTIWDVDTVTSKASGATIHLTPNGKSVLIFTDQGNLIRAQLGAEGYKELSRTHVVDPTCIFAGRKLIWPPPAYANGHLFIHNGEELLCVSLQSSQR